MLKHAVLGYTTDCREYKEMSPLESFQDSLLSRQPEDGMHSPRKHA